MPKLQITVLLALLLTSFVTAAPITGGAISPGQDTDSKNDGWSIGKTNRLRSVDSDNDHWTIKPNRASPRAVAGVDSDNTHWTIGKSLNAEATPAAEKREPLKVDPGNDGWTIGATTPVVRRKVSVDQKNDSWSLKPQASDVVERAVDVDTDNSDWHIGKPL